MDMSSLQRFCAARASAARPTSGAAEADAADADGARTASKARAISGRCRVQERCALDRHGPGSWTTISTRAEYMRCLRRVAAPRTRPGRVLVQAHRELLRSLVRAHLFQFGGREHRTSGPAGAWDAPLLYESESEDAKLSVCTYRSAPPAQRGEARRRGGAVHTRCPTVWKASGATPCGR